MLATLQHLRVKDLMTPFLHVVGAGWPLHQVAEFMVEHEITGAPVVHENGTLIGVISQTDVLRYLAVPARNPVPTGAIPEALAAYTEAERAGFEVHDHTQPTAAQLMTATLFRVDEETLVQEAAMLMRNGRIHRLFVTRGGRVVGIVSAFDLLKVIQGLLDQVVIDHPSANPLDE